MTPTLPPMEPDTARLTGLLFELASQLHVERTRRLALEMALVRSGALAPGATDALAGDGDLLAGARAELETAMRKLMRVLGDSDDPRAPLRNDLSASHPSPSSK